MIQPIHTIALCLSVLFIVVDVSADDSDWRCEKALFGVQGVEFGSIMHFGPMPDKVDACLRMGGEVIDCTPVWRNTTGAIMTFGHAAFRRVCYVPGVPKGTHEAVDDVQCTTSGWACDPSDYARSIDVHLYANKPAGYASSVYLGSVNASAVRSDSTTSKACGGTRAHGFTFNLPSEFRDGKNHRIYAYAINIGPGASKLLSKSPKTIKCQLAPAVPAVALQAEPEIVESGQASELQWTYSDLEADAPCLISGDDGSRFTVTAGGGSRMTNPLLTTGAVSFTIQCTRKRDGRTASLSTIVTVQPVQRFTASCAMDQVSASWSAVPGAVSYKVQKAEEPAFTTFDEEATAETAAQFLPPYTGRPFFLRLLSIDAAGKVISSRLANGNGAIECLKHEPPEVEAVCSGGKLSVTWTDSPTMDASRQYRVQISQSADYGTLLVGQRVTGNLFEWTSIVPGEGYYVRVRTATNDSIRMPSEYVEALDGALVMCPLPAPAVAIRANPNPVSYAGTTVLTWSTEHLLETDPCLLTGESNWSLASNAGGGGSGVRSPVLLRNSIFSIQCTRASDNQVAGPHSVLVVVPTLTPTPTPTPTVTPTVTPTITPTPRSGRMVLR